MALEKVITPAGTQDPESPNVDPMPEMPVSKGSSAASRSAESARIDGLGASELASGKSSPGQRNEAKVRQTKRGGY